MSCASRVSFGILWLSLSGAVTAFGQPAESTRYRMIEGTLLTHVDPGGPGIVEAMHGTFDLVPTVPPAEFAVQEFRGFDQDGVQRVTGKGTYMFNWGYQVMVLDVLIDGNPHHLDSGWVPFETFLPMLKIDLFEKAVPGEPVYGIHLLGAPAYAVWFSAEIGFHTPVGKFISDGDALTSFGGVLWTNHELTAKLGIEPVVPDIGLDAINPVEIDGPKWWECWFSAEMDVFSEKLGPLKHGDFLSEGGFIVAKNEELLKNFYPPLPIDYGLDAITWSWGCKGWYFSTEVDFLSAGGPIGHGDLLCAQHGQVFLKNGELLAKFAIQDPVRPDYGLDAVYLWPSGHVWFSVEDGFDDLNYGWISDGDLLSSDGRVICRNLALLQRFNPKEDLANFGLDALHIVPVQRGDMNGDAFINAFDIDWFVMALVDREEYYKFYPELSPDVVGDLNFDGVLNAFDIDPFVELLTGG